MKTRFAFGCLFALVAFVFFSATATEPAAITPFSAAPPGAALPGGWRALSLPNLKSPEFRLEQDDAGTTVLRAEAQAAAGTIAFNVRADTHTTPLLTWRWKIDGVVEQADLKVKSGDDFAARVYVFFDVPVDSLSFATRTKIRLAKLLYGTEVPSAALCYVWDNKYPVGTSVWNPYTDRVRTIVLQSGNGKAGKWQSETRDLARDFEAAFALPAPAVTGIAIGNDTDQSGASAVAWFGDFSFKAKP